MKSTELQNDRPALRLRDSVVALAVLSAVLLAYFALRLSSGAIGDEVELPLVIATATAIICGAIGIPLAITGAGKVAQWQWRLELPLSAVATLVGIAAGSTFLF